jgi:hypothetical protein
VTGQSPTATYRLTVINEHIVESEARELLTKDQLEQRKRDAELAKKYPWIGPPSASDCTVFKAGTSDRGTGQRCAS